jgi:hypothetical protein
VTKLASALICDVTDLESCVSAIHLAMWKYVSASTHDPGTHHLAYITQSMGSSKQRQKEAGSSYSETTLGYL